MTATSDGSAQGARPRRLVRMVRLASILPLAVALAAVLLSAAAAAGTAWDGTGSFTFTSTPAPSPCSGSGTATISLDGDPSSLTGPLSVTFGSRTSGCAGAGFPSSGSTITVTAVMTLSGGTLSGHTVQPNGHQDALQGTLSGSTMHLTMTITTEPTPGIQCVGYCTTIFQFTFTGSGSISGGFGFGGLGPLDPSNPLFVPTLLSTGFGIGGIAAANAKPPVPTIQSTLPGRPSWWKPLRPGIPASMTANLVSLRDIPIGAVRLSPPRTGMYQGKPTDVTRQTHCPNCGAPSGYTVAGWFCLSPQCARRRGPETLFPQVGQTYGHQPMTPPPPPPPP